jgi:hypothetical protein
MHSDPFINLLSGGNNEPVFNEEESVWNLFVQLLLPLILILTFLSVMDILRYKIRGDVVEMENRNLRENIGKISGTVDKENWFRNSQRSILEVQRQKVMRALAEIRPEEYRRIKLARFVEGTEIKMEGLDVVDEVFLSSCKLTRDYLVRRSNEYHSDLYARVLQRAGLSDPIGYSIKTRSEDQELFDERQILSADVATISKANAFFIHNRIIEFVDHLQQMSLDLQLGVMMRIYDELPKHPTAMSHRGRKLVQQMLRPDIDEKERIRLSDEIYREFNDEVRCKVEGYGFLDVALNQIARLD